MGVSESLAANSEIREVVFIGLDDFLRPAAAVIDAEAAEFLDVGMQILKELRHRYYTHSTAASTPHISVCRAPLRRAPGYTLT